MWRFREGSCARLSNVPAYRLQEILVYVFLYPFCTITLRVSRNALVSERRSQLCGTAPAAWYVGSYDPHSLEKRGNSSFEMTVLCTRSVVMTRRC